MKFIVNIQFCLDVQNELMAGYSAEQQKDGIRADVVDMLKGDKDLPDVVFITVTKESHLHCPAETRDWGGIRIKPL